MTAAILSSHHPAPPYGLAGGENGMPDRNSVLRTDGSTEVLLGGDRTEMAAGDIFITETPRRRLGPGGAVSVSGGLIVQFNKLRKIWLK